MLVEGELPMYVPFSEHALAYILTTHHHISRPSNCTLQPEPDWHKLLPDPLLRGIKAAAQSPLQRRRHPHPHSAYLPACLLHLLACLSVMHAWYGMG